MKRAISLVISVMMLLSMLTGITFTAGAETTPTVEFLTQPEGWNLIDGLQTGTQMYSDNEDAQIIIDDEDVLGLEGMPFIQTQNADSSAWNSYGSSINSQMTQAKLTVNSSCDVYVFTKSMSSYDKGGNEAGKDYLIWLNSPDFAFEMVRNADGTPFTLTFKDHSGADMAHYVYKKSLNIPDGLTSVIELGYIGKWCDNYMYSAAVVWSNDRDEAKAEHSLSFTTNSTNQWAINRNVQLHDPVFTDAYYEYDWWNNSSSPYSHGLDYYGLEGADAIMTANNDLNDKTCASSSSTIDSWGSVTIGHSADIYIVSTGETARSDAQSRWMNWTIYNGFNEVRDEEGNHLRLSLKNVDAGGMSHMFLYKRTVYVPEGETATVELGRLGAWCVPMYSVIVKWIEDENPEKVASVTNNNGTNWKILHHTSITADNYSRLYYGGINKKDSYSGGDYVTSVSENFDFTDVSIVQPARDEYWMGYNTSIKSHQTLETVTVNNSCEVYILNRYAPETRCLAWIYENGFQKQEGGVTTTDSDANGYAFQVYKRTYKLLDGETADIPIGGTSYTWCNSTPAIIIKWIDNVTDKGPQVSFTVPDGATSQYYIYTPETFVGDRLAVGAGLHVTDYGQTGLEGLSVLKPFNGDMVSTGYTVDPSTLGEEGVNPQVFDYYNITLDTTAEIFVSSSVKPNDDYMEWLKGWELLTDEAGEPLTYTTSNLNNTTYITNYVYKRLYVVPEGQTRTVALRNAGLGLASGGMYQTFFKFYEGDMKTHTVSIQADEGAKVFPHDLSVDVADGDTIPLSIGFEDGYYVKSVKLDGVEVLSNVYEDDVIYTTSAITADTAVVVETDLLENMPLPESLESLAAAFTAKGEEDLIVGAKVYPLNVIAFGTAKASYGAYERGEFGMLVLMEKPDSIDELTVANENVIRATAEGSNSAGQYGVRLYGDNIASGQKCYLRAYAYYGDTVIYGTNLIEAEF